VLTTIATRGDGVEAVVDAIEAHGVYLRSSGELLRRRRARLERHTREVVERAVRQLVWRARNGNAVLAAGLERVVEGRESPYDLARTILGALTGDTNERD
jgi:LAO/AO transport system kinase